MLTKTFGGGGEINEGVKKKSILFVVGLVACCFFDSYQEGEKDQTQDNVFPAPNNRNYCTVFFFSNQVFKWRFLPGETHQSIVGTGWQQQRFPSQQEAERSARVPWSIERAVGQWIPAPFGCRGVSHPGNDIP